MRKRVLLTNPSLACCRWTAGGRRAVSGGKRSRLRSGGGTRSSGNMIQVFPREKCAEIEFWMSTYVKFCFLCDVSEMLFNLPQEIALRSSDPVGTKVGLTSKICSTLIGSLFISYLTSASSALLLVSLFSLPLLSVLPFRRFSNPIPPGWRVGPRSGKPLSDPPREELSLVLPYPIHTLIIGTI